MYVQVSSALNQGGVDQDRGSHLGLYNRALDRGRRGGLWSWLTGRSRRLLDLKEIEARCRVYARASAGLHTVPIEQIRGSEGRVSDFDCCFNPLQNHTKERWLGVAAARQRGRVLPPVDLVQLGDLYFVLDGHHRLSVARALGQEYIEARVTVWEVEGPLPWERSASTSKLALQPV